MRFWQEVDGLLLRQAAKHADAIRAAFIRSIDVDDIVQRWAEAHPAGGVVSAAEARDWAKQNVPVARKPLADALDHVYATGWVMGQDASTAAYAHAQLGVQKAAPTAKQMTAALNTNWDTWKPGNKPAALLVRPSGKFAQLLETGRAGIKGMNDTTLDRVGTLLADSLESGKAYTDLSKKLLTDTITSRVVKDASRAGTIAVTEMSRALNTATVDNYNQFGVEKVEWLAIDTGVCDICPANEAQGPIPIGQMFQSGDSQPPAHPNCRCTILPVVGEGPEMTDEQFAQAIMGGELPPVPVEVPAVDLTPVAMVVPEGAFAPGQWATLDFAARKQFAFDEVSAIRRTGVTDDQIERYLARDKKTQDFINKGQLIKNGDVHIRIPGGGLAEKYIQAVLREVETLNLAFPRPNMVVSIGTAARNSYGSAIRGDSHINLAKTGTVMKAFEIGSIEAGTFKMPSRAEVSQLKYTLTHEWGHAIDVARGDAGALERANRVKQLVKDVPGFLSQYGATDPAETFAEMFAEFFLTKGQTDNQLVQAFAREFGWIK